MEGIIFKGIRKLSVDEKSVIINLSGRYYSKLARIVKDSYLEVHLKEHKDREGVKKRKKYTFLIRCKCGKHFFEVKDFEWDLKKALHKAFKVLISEVKQKLKS